MALERLGRGAPIRIPQRTGDALVRRGLAIVAHEQRTVKRWHIGHQENSDKIVTVTNYTITPAGRTVLGLTPTLRERLLAERGGR